MRSAWIFVLLSALTPGTFSQLHHFIFVPLNMNWSEAQTYCRQRYTDLATVLNKQDNDNLLKVMANVSSWIGLYRTSSETPLIWSDDSKSTYADWAPGQPNNYDNAQWCVHVFSNLWNDQDCSKTFPFVCYLEEKRHKRIVRLEVKSGQDLNDPEVMKNILAKMQQILRENGLAEHDELSWRIQSDGNIFQKKDQKRDATEQTCL